jgi:hypothetical protein
MQKKWMLGVAAVAALALTGCGDTCDDLADGFKVAEQKARPCSSGPSEAFNINQCDSNLNQCTDSEKQALADLANCLRKLPECTPGNTTPFENSLAACALGVSGKVGENCSNIFGN